MLGQFVCYHLKQWWLVVHCGCRNEIKWNMSKDTAMIIQEYVFDNCFSNMSPAMFWPQFSNQLIPTGPQKFNLSPLIADYPFCVGYNTTVLLSVGTLRLLSPAIICDANIWYTCIHNYWYIHSKILLEVNPHFFKLLVLNLQLLRCKFIARCLDFRLHKLPCCMAN